MKREPLLKVAPFSGSRVQPFKGRRRYLSTGDLQDSSISFVEVTYEDKPSRADIVVKPGDVLFARMKGTIKVLEIERELSDIIVSTGFAVLRPTETCNGKFLSIYLKSGDFKRQKEKYCSGAIQPAITNAGVKKIVIPLPPLNDQKRIAHLLGKVEGLITRRKQHLQQLDDLLKSVFLEMFGDPISNPKGYPVRKLSEFYINPKEGTKCGPFGSALKKDEIVSSGVPVWNMDNIDLTGRMVMPFRMWITEEKYKELNSYSVIDGDIIISRAGTVGKMCIARTDGEPAIISTNLIRLRLGNELRPLHVVSLMTYCKGRVGRLKTGPDGSFTHMNTGILDKLEFPYPPIDLQDQFAAVVEKVEDLKSRYQQSLTDLETLYGALSQKAFNGELDLSQVPLPEDIIGEAYMELPELEVEAHGMVEQITYELPDPGDLEIFESAEGRRAILEQWLDVYLGQLGNTPFSAKQFMETAQQKLWDLVEDDAPEWGIAEYEELKSFLFEKIGARKIKQTRNITCVNEKRQFGKQVILRARTTRNS